jgi:hypothetical protein
LSFAYFGIGRSVDDECRHARRRGSGPYYGSEFTDRGVRLPPGPTQLTRISQGFERSSSALDFETSPAR